MTLAGVCPSIEKIIICLTNNYENSCLSATEVSEHVTFDTNQRPRINGLYDSRMGIIQNKFQCATCGKGDNTCLGHFGHYKIKNGIILNPIAHNNIIKWLRIVCLKCGYPMFDISKPIAGSKKLQSVASKINDNGKRSCLNGACGAIHPKVSVSNKDHFLYNLTLSNLSTETLNLLDVYNIFQKIPPWICGILKISPINHPANYFMNTIPISPNTIRPPPAPGKVQGQNSIMLDTFKKIIRLDNQAFTEEQLSALNTEYYNMARKPLPPPKGKRVKPKVVNTTKPSILPSFASKKGTIRKFILGKRSLNVARNTISGTSQLLVYEIGIPIDIAKVLEKVETVRDFNYDRLSQYVLDGTCKKIKRKLKTHSTFVKDEDRINVKLEIGDQIIRSLVDGDLIEFNRQPSLNESAISTHVVKIMKDISRNTFEINVTVCSNYNADFDGDQMRLKCLTSKMALAEAKWLTTCCRWMLTHQTSNLMNGQVQDTIVGSAIMTRSTTRIDRLHAIRLFKHTKLNDIVLDKQVYTGREILSLLLKRTPVSYRGEATFYLKEHSTYVNYDPIDTQVIIDRGEIVSGIIDKSTIGGGNHGNLFHLIALVYGTKIAMDVVFQYQQIIMEFLYMRGFTMSLNDLVLPKETRTVINRTINDTLVKSRMYAKKLVNGQVYPPVGVNLEDYYEEQQKQILGGPEMALGPIMSAINIDNNNGLRDMTLYRSRGKPTQLSTTLGFLGSMLSLGKRIPYSLSSWRTSIRYPRYELDALSRGYVPNSLVEGLEPQYITFTSIVSREQLIRKTQTTSKTGQLQRTHIKNLENAVMNHMFAVRKSQMIVQFVYGEDGFDPRYLHKQPIPTFHMSNDEIYSKYYISIKNSKLVDEWMKNIIDDRNKCRELFRSLQYSGFTKKHESSIKLVLEYNDIIERFIDTKINLSDSELESSLKRAKGFIDNFVYIYSNEMYKKKKGFMDSYYETGIFFYKVFLRIIFAPKNLSHIATNKMSEIENYIIISVASKLLSPGSCVGAQAGQSISAPMIQNMLNSVHGASGGIMNTVDRVNEILSGKKSKPANNSMYIYIKPEYRGNESLVKTVANMIKGVTIKSIISSWQIFLEEFNNPVHPIYKHEKEIITTFNSAHKVPNNLSKWVIRFQFDKKKLIHKSISVETVVEKLIRKYKLLYFVYTTESNDNSILRVYIQEDMLKHLQSAGDYIINTFIYEMLDFTVRGIAMIKETSVHPYETFDTEEDGSTKKQRNYYIRTIGEDLRSLVTTNFINKDYIDLSKTQIVSPASTLAYFGIEETRTNIIASILSTVDPTPDYHHATVYADILTYPGYIIGIENCIALERNSTLSKASISRAQPILMQAAIDGIEESIRSVSSTVFMGGIPKVGTNYNDYLMNEKFISENQ